MSTVDGIELFDYAESADAPFVPSWSGWEAAPDTAEADQRIAGNEEAGTAEWNRRIAEESRLSFEAGRARGVEEGRAAERAASAASRSKAREEQIRQAADLVAGFEGDRGHYFQAIEQEVVKLALAVAARILRREAQTDPLLLLGAVRVALGQISASTEVSIRVPAEDLDLWTEAIALLPNLKTKPQVIAGEGIRLGECVLETKLGHAELSVSHQLAEIECSVLEKRPAGDASRTTAAASAEGVR